jgi:hypothetical protein
VGRPRPLLNAYSLGVSEATLARDPLNLENAYAFAARHSLSAEVDEIKQWRVDPGMKGYIGTDVRKHLLVDLFTAKDLMADFRTAHWPIKTSKDRLEKLGQYKKHFAQNEETDQQWPPTWRRERAENDTRLAAQ